MSSRVIKLLHAILFRTAATTRAVLGGLLLLLFYSGVSSASETRVYTASGVTDHFATYAAVCDYWLAQPLSGGVVSTSLVSISSTSSPAGSYYSGFCTIRSTYANESYIDGARYFSSSLIACSDPDIYDYNLKACSSPPPPECPAGSFWDFDTASCKYPQDDACASIGASWNPAASACQCNSPTAALVTAAGVTRCMQLRDDSCDSNSPDFKGYGPSGQAICDGRASCPGGGIPGYVGSGDTLSAICYNNPADPNENCDGQSGLVNGVEVCIPNPGDDPDFPDCSGVVGLVNGVKTCIHKPNDHPGCKPGETAGYVGAGANAQFTCIPSDYKPQTCPPGQYVTNAETGGFGCATASGQSSDDIAAGKVPGKGSATSQTTQKDADGNTVGTEESELQIDLTGLTEDTPANNYKEEMDEFSDSELDAIDTDSIVGSFSGADGAFTERSSLTNLSSFVKTHTIGNSTNCSGSLPFFGSTISCEKFSTYNRIVGWMIFILTLINIYNVIMRKSDSGV